MILLLESALVMNTLDAEPLNTVYKTQGVFIITTNQERKSLSHRQRWIELNNNKYQIYKITENHI